jgi:hypothetical protein
MQNVKERSKRGEDWGCRREEERFFGRSDDRDCEAARARIENGRSVPSAGDQRGHVLWLESKFGDMDVSEAQRL